MWISFPTLLLPTPALPPMTRTSLRTTAKNASRPCPPRARSSDPSGNLKVTREQVAIAPDLGSRTSPRSLRRPDTDQVRRIKDPGPPPARRRPSAPCQATLRYPHHSSTPPGTAAHTQPGVHQPRDAPIL